MPAPRAQSPASSENLDVPCLDCGYNLRGLPGDPRRCPECGLVNPVLVDVPESLIQKHLWHLNRVPMACVGGAVVGVLVGLPAVALAVGHRGGLSLLLFAAIPWAAGLWHFRRACGGRRGWARDFAEYQLVGLAMMFFLIACGSTGLLLLGSLAGRLHNSFAIGTLGVLLLVVVVGWGTSYGLGRLKRRFDPIFREDAERRARDEVRRLKAKSHLASPDAAA